MITQRKLFKQETLRIGVELGIEFNTPKGNCRILSIENGIKVEFVGGAFYDVEGIITFNDLQEFNRYLKKSWIPVIVSLMLCDDYPKWTFTEHVICVDVYEPNYRFIYEAIQDYTELHINIDKLFFGKPKKSLSVAEIRIDPDYHKKGIRL